MIMIICVVIIMGCFVAAGGCLYITDLIEGEPYRTNSLDKIDYAVDKIILVIVILGILTLAIFICEAVPFLNEKVIPWIQNQAY